MANFLTDAQKQTLKGFNFWTKFTIYLSYVGVFFLGLIGLIYAGLGLFWIIKPLAELGRGIGIFCLVFGLLYLGLAAFYFYIYNLYLKSTFKITNNRDQKDLTAEEFATTVIEGVEGYRKVTKISLLVSLGVLLFSIVAMVALVGFSVASGVNSFNDTKIDSEFVSPNEIEYDSFDDINSINEPIDSSEISNLTEEELNQSIQDIFNEAPADVETPDNSTDVISQ
jgi:hypothetical protein